MSSRGYRGFIPTAQRPAVQQTALGNDGASSSAPAEGAASIVQPRTDYRPSLLGDQRYQTSPPHHDNTQTSSPNLDAMHDFMAQFDTPTPDTVASMFVVDGGVSDDAAGAAQHPQVTVAHAPPSDKGQDAEDPFAQSLRPDQLRLICE
jgi:hypothetical protein